MTENTANDDTMADEAYMQMAAYLENLLTRQVDKLRRYDLDGAVRIAEEATEIASRLGVEDVLERQEFSAQKKRLDALYKDIELIIETERSEVANKIKQIRKGKRTLGAYKNNG